MALFGELFGEGGEEEGEYKLEMEGWEIWNQKYLIRVCIEVFSLIYMKVALAKKTSSSHPMTWSRFLQNSSISL